jgi:hypothetical protein
MRHAPEHPDRNNPRHREAALALAGMLNASIVKRRRAAHEHPMTIDDVLAAACIVDGRMWVRGTISVDLPQ